MKILGIILARGGSKRIPRKNLKKIDGKSLVEISIEQALNSKYIQDVIVSTDDKEIKSVSLEAGAKVIERPEEYKNDNTINEADNIIIDLIKKLEIKKLFYDIFVLLYPTAPLRTVNDIDSSIEKIINDGYDSVLTLSRDQSYFWKTDIDGNNLAPFNYDPKYRVPSAIHDYIQYKENKAVYAFSRDLIIETNCRIGGKIGFVLMPSLNSIDIDVPEDFELVKVLNKIKGENSNK